MCYVCSESLKDPFSQCARHLLARTLVKARENGLSFLVGFEIEFVLLDSSGKSPTTLDNVEAWSTMGGLRGKNLVIMESIVGALEASGIAVFHFHTETPPQLELALEPLPPMQAVDSLMLAQETIRHVCIEHGYKATMITKPLLDNASVFSSVHTHLSITPSDSENCFLAGLLHSLRSICALGMASYDSYVRVKEGSETVGVWVSWGTQNRGVPIRKIGSGHWEIRTVDSTANFYLLLSAVIAAGVGGIESSLQLRLKDCRIFPSQMTPDDRLEVAIDTRLPLSLRESIEFLSQDASMKKWLGDILWNSYISTKKRDEAVFDEMMDEPRRQNMLKYF
ncbi:hypothetical protein MMC17_008002 [Xylographa soralifera]|nr:hypothetical protein [Xylographa soralifera]